MKKVAIIAVLILCVFISGCKDPVGGEEFHCPSCKEPTGRIDDGSNKNGDGCAFFKMNCSSCGLTSGWFSTIHDAIEKWPLADTKKKTK